LGEPRGTHFWSSSLLSLSYSIIFNTSCLNLVSSFYEYLGLFWILFFPLVNLHLI
jgi:hypothetical protein